MADAIAIILGSAFHDGDLGRDIKLEREVVETRWGAQPIWRVRGDLDRPAYVIFRHGVPHRLLPHQINWRAQASALAQVGCGALVVTSSVGVLDEDVPIGRPMLVGDLLMPDNRLPDGSTCTMFPHPEAAQGHLVLEEGLFSDALGAQLEGLARQLDVELGPRVIFTYVGGPRTKTAAENRYWRALGAQVNSMSLGPEVVLANELRIPCAGLVVGHKRSSGASRARDVDGAEDVARSLKDARDAQRALVALALRELAPVPFTNLLYTFEA